MLTQKEYSSVMHYVKKMKDIARTTLTKRTGMMIATISAHTQTGSVLKVGEGEKFSSSFAFFILKSIFYTPFLPRTKYPRSCK